MRPFRRVFHENLDGESVGLVPEESHHLVKVLRLKTGDRIEVFDGKGGSRQARVGETKKGVSEVVFSGPVHIQPRMGTRITLAVAPPKGQRMDTLVQMAQEIGLDRLVPMVTENSVQSDFSENRYARWKRVAVAAAKQSGGNHVVDISPEVDFEELAAGGEAWDLRILCHNGAENTSLRECLRATSRPETALACVGPEGGFTEREINSAREAGFAVVRFSTPVLRVETAAVYILSALRTEFDDFAL